MTASEPMELSDALMLLRADHDSARRLLLTDLEALGASQEEREIWLTALDDMHRAAAGTLFRIESGAPPKLTVN